MTSLADLEREIGEINERNKRVEEDKAWETSLTRRILLVVFTYLAIGLYMNAISIDKPWLNAIIPSLGFVLSTLSLPFFKGFWKRYIHKT